MDARSTTMSRTAPYSEAARVCECGGRREREVREGERVNAVLLGMTLGLELGCEGAGRARRAVAERGALCVSMA